MKPLLMLIGCLLLLLTACETDRYTDGVEVTSSESEEYANDEAAENDGYLQLEPPRTAEPPPPPTAPEPQASVNKKIIYTGEIRMQVDSLEAAIESIGRLVTAAGGFISNQHLSDSRYEKNAALTLRLPVTEFAPSMRSITELATFVNHQNLDSRDVTAQWIDLESRLSTKREVRDRYIDILRNRARKVEDILEAEEKIRVITEEIEAKEGQLRYLRDQVSLSTLQLNLYQTVEYREAPDTYRRGFGRQLVNALGDGLSLVRGLVLGLISIWPLWFLVPVVVWGWRKWRSR